MNGARSRIAGALAAFLAIAGIVLAVQARQAGSLPRYQLVGYVVGGCLCLPLLVWSCGPRIRRLGRRLLFACVPVLILLALMELGWRCFGPAAVPQGALRADARLGHVMVPGSDGTDALGFRNPRVIERPDVLFVGDSQTWGFQVAADATMSNTFAQTTGASAYQMSNGSYGPVQYVELVRVGLLRSPRAVVVALYFGNDIFDAADYTGLEGAESLRTDGRPLRHRHNPELDGIAAPNWTMALVDGALAHSRTLDFAAHVVKSRLQGGALDAQPGSIQFSDPRVATVLLPEYRLDTLRPDSEMVRDGLLVTGRALVAIQQQCAAANARLLLVLIPTKESAYASWQAGLRQEQPALGRLHAAEAAARATVLQQASTAAIAVHDLLPDCIRALTEGTPIWPVGGDGHLNANGHALVAAAVAAWWRGS